MATHGVRWAPHITNGHDADDDKETDDDKKEIDDDKEGTDNERATISMKMNDGLQVFSLNFF